MNPPVIILSLAVALAGDSYAGRSVSSVPYIERSWNGTKVVYTTEYAENVKEVPGNGGKTVILKHKKLKKNKQTIKRSKAIKVSGAKGTVRYKKTGGNKKIKINAKSGKITVMKGLRKGTYKVKVRVTAAGTGSYLKGSETVTVIIKLR